MKWKQNRVIMIMSDGFLSVEYESGIKIQGTLTVFNLTSST